MKKDLPLPEGPSTNLLRFAIINVYKNLSI